MIRLPGTPRRLNRRLNPPHQAPEGVPMPPNRAPAAMVKTPMHPVLTALGSGCKSFGGALAAPTETDHAPPGRASAARVTGAASFALVGVATAVGRAPGQRVGFVMPATAGDIHAR
jgi:hypothetical protein